MIAFACSKTLVRFLACSAILFSPLGAVAFEPPPTQDAPHSTAGGGSRPVEGSCLAAETAPFDAIALAPEGFVGLTNQAQPTLWLYLPRTDEAIPLELSLFDEQFRGIAQAELELHTDFDDVHSNQVDLHKTHSIKTNALEGQFVFFQLPASFKFSPGRAYYWSAAIICDPNHRTQDWIVGGWIRYQPLTSTQQKAWPRLSPRTQIEKLMQAGYWYDSVTAIIMHNNDVTSPKSLSVAWEELLRRGNVRWPLEFKNGSSPLLP